MNAGRGAAARAGVERAVAAYRAKRADGVFYASYESHHFSFEAAGRTEAAAREEMVKILDRHGEEYGCEKNWWWGRTAEEAQDEISVLFLRFGTGYRDHSEVK